MKPIYICFLLARFWVIKFMGFIHCIFLSSYVYLIHCISLVIILFLHNREGMRTNLSRFRLLLRTKTNRSCHSAKMSIKVI